MSAGYSGTPLVRKLGIKPGFRISLIGAPEHYEALLEGFPDGVAVLGTRARNLDFVHLFATRESELVRGFRSARPRLAPAGMVWASWPKKASGVDTELSGPVVRSTGLAAGLVDVKVCAVDDTWSGLKFVIPVADRGA